jgi:hypothetical protein
MYKNRFLKNKIRIKCFLSVIKIKLKKELIRTPDNKELDGVKFCIKQTDKFK